MFETRRWYRCVPLALLQGLPHVLLLLFFFMVGCEADPAAEAHDTWTTDGTSPEMSSDVRLPEGQDSAPLDPADGAEDGSSYEASEVAGDDLPLAPCPTPRGPALSITHASAELRFHVAGGALIQTGWAEGADASEPAAWADQPELMLPTLPLPATVTLFARVVDESCGPEHWFMHVTELRDTYPGPAGTPGTTAIPADSPAIVGWANSYASPVSWGEDLIGLWQAPEEALGPASGDPGAVCSLGNGGALTLSFAGEIRDDAGPDLAVFENGLTDRFLELAWVEVSSDGEHWLRFDSAYLGHEPVPAYGGHDATLIGGLAGAYRVGFGVPFDLATLQNRAAVRQGLVDLQGITAVRLVDVRGDGSQLDSFGAPIYDPHKTVESAGFDLDGVAVLHAAQ